MQEEKKFLALLQVAVPGDTSVTVQAEIKVLEMLGIVSSPETVHSMNLAASLIPANVQATLYGLVGMLGNLIKNHPKATKHHHDELSKITKSLTSMPDATLTYSTFLPICESLMKAKAQKIQSDTEGRSGKK